jgi:hypothetical protein
MPTCKSSGAHVDLRFELSESSWKIGDDTLPELSKISPSPLSLSLPPEVVMKKGI